MVPPTIRISQFQLPLLLCSIALLFCTFSPANGQSSIDSLISKIDPQKWSASIERRVSNLEDKIISKSQKTLAKLQRQEEKICRRMIQSKDSLQRKAALADIKNKYRALRDKLKSPSSDVARYYHPKLDTLNSVLKFLDQNPHSTVGGNVKQALEKVRGLQDKFQQAEEIKKFIRERKRLLHQQLSQYGFVKSLKKISKRAYYYQQQVEEYKALLNDHKKAIRKGLVVLGSSKLFRDFMRKNSMLASLFRSPGSPLPTSPGGGGLAGLQTRTQVNNLIQSQIGGSPSAMQQFRGNLANAQAQLNQLKNKVGQLGGGSSDEILPEGFKPNKARSLPFLKRIQLSTDFQTTRHNKLFPLNSDLGFAISYLLNSNSHLSIGSSFKIGWGTGFNHIRLTAQGTSIRAGLDWRLKNNLFIAGNYEQHYFSQVRNIDQLRDYGSWKTAALLGLSKKYKTGKRKGGSVTLLYDFFYNRPPIRTQPVTIRFGFNLK